MPNQRGDRLGGHSSSSKAALGGGIRRDFEKVSFAGADLSRCSASNSRFGDAWLYKTKFIDADLTNAYFRGSVYADFSGAKLSGAQFHGSLAQSAFKGADLRNASFARVAIADTCNFDDALFDETTDFTGAEVSGSFTKHPVFRHFEVNQGVLSRKPPFAETGSFVLTAYPVGPEIVAPVLTGYEPSSTEATAEELQSFEAKRAEEEAKSTPITAQPKPDNYGVPGARAISAGPAPLDIAQQTALDDNPRSITAEAGVYIGGVVSRRRVLRVGPKPDEGWNEARLLATQIADLERRLAALEIEEVTGPTQPGRLHNGPPEALPIEPSEKAEIATALVELREAISELQPAPTRVDRALQLLTSSVTKLLQGIHRRTGLLLDEAAKEFGKEIGKSLGSSPRLVALWMVWTGDLSAVLHGIATIIKPLLGAG